MTENFTSVQIVETEGRLARRSYRVEIIFNIDGETETFIQEYTKKEYAEKAVKHMIRFMMLKEIELECC